MYNDKTKTIEMKNQLLIDLNKSEEYQLVKAQYKSLILQLRTYRQLYPMGSNLPKLFKMASKRRILLQFI
jgi:hypothetical protein